MLIRLLKAAIIASIALLAIAGLLFTVLTWQINAGKTNEVVIRNDSDLTLTHVEVTIAKKRHNLGDLPARPHSQLDVRAGGEGTVTVAFMIGPDIFRCNGNYVTAGISSYTEVLIEPGPTLRRRFYYPENGKNLTYYPCAETQQDQ